MRLVTFAPPDGRERLGLIDGDAVREVAVGPGPDPMLRYIALSPADRHAAATAATAGTYPTSDITVLAPIPRPPRNVFCVGKNYHDHAAEFHASGFDVGSARPRPDHPVFFTKATTAVAAPGTAIPAHLDPTGTVDYEGELAVVIGVGGRSIPAAAALAHVFGYTAFNDVTSRELQRRHGQWFLGKSIDGFGPMGPCVVTADEIPDPAALALTVAVNGDERQAARVSDLIFSVPELIECLSAVVTLRPGDVIATGTPAGVGVGHTPPRYLRPGDTVTVTIDRIGTLSNPVAGPPA
jgi:2-keto-4-pentenoate hydratase/2-oxohepta-3-ene-1,7-dioic acid hydratase in catechol pathway